MSKLLAHMVSFSRDGDAHNISNPNCCLACHRVGSQHGVGGTSDYHSLETAIMFHESHLQEPH